MTRASRRSDAIVALATPPGAAERAVLRLSGPGLLAAADQYLPPACPRPRGRREWRSGELEWAPGARVEVGLLVLPGPGSATGEDSLELHLPSSMPVVRAVLARLVEAGLRPAEAGEFTRRAFRNGRIDLAGAEAVRRLVEARGAGEAAAAASLLTGRSGATLARIRDALDQALVECEAGLDFEEGDSQDVHPEALEARLARAGEELGVALVTFRRPETPPTVPRIGLRGLPNAGKTTLFRALSGASALVSSRPGTTRDRLEAHWHPRGEGEEGCLLLDGPGLGSAPVDVADRAARRRAAADRADLWWVLVDASDPEGALPPLPESGESLLLFTKAELPRRVPDRVLREAAERGCGEALWVSARTGTGLAELAERSLALLAAQAERRADRGLFGERSRVALEEAAAALDRAREFLREGSGTLVLVAEELRAARRALGGLLGEDTPEELLDRIFSRFCVGK